MISEKQAVVLNKRCVVHRTVQLPVVPPRSRLYGLAPCAMGTAWSESLTSYVNRLGSKHGVSPRVLLAQEILPKLQGSYPRYRFDNFCRGLGATGINGTGDLALEGATLLNHLTGRADLASLTLRCWIGSCAVRGLFREYPAWCPACYAEWQATQYPLYQPLLWMLDIVTICTRHRRWLMERCPRCGKSQSILAVNTVLGQCTQCHVMFGEVHNGEVNHPLAEETVIWQNWVIHALNELHQHDACVSWEQFFSNVAKVPNAYGAPTKLIKQIGMNPNVFARWTGRLHVSRAYTPTLKAILYFCYACQVTPWQIMSDPGLLPQRIQHAAPMSRMRSPQTAPKQRIDRERCQQFLHAVLAGQEAVMSVHQLAQQLGYDDTHLWHYFPQECRLIAQRFREHQSQRRAAREQQVGEEVRQKVALLHAQGVYPSGMKVKTLLTDPNQWRMPQARTAWHAACRELGLELAIS